MKVPGRGVGRQTGKAIGIFLDAYALRIALRVQGEIIRVHSAPLPSDCADDVGKQAAFAVDALDGFWRGWRHVPVWLCATVPSLQMRFFSVPKVGDRSQGDSVYWTFRKDLPFDVSQSIFDFSLTEEGGASGKLRAMAFTAAKSEVGELLAAFDAMGVSLAGIVIPAIALRQFCAQVGVLPSKAGSASASFRDEGSQVRMWVHAGDALATVLVTRAGALLGCRIFKSGVSAAEVRGLLSKPDGLVESDEPLRSRLVQQVDRTITAHMSEFPGAPIQEIVLTGPLAGLPGWGDSMGAALGIPVRCELGGKAEGVYLPAIGAACSDASRTPNFLFPYRERQALRQRQRYQQYASIGLGLGAAVIFLGALWLGRGNVALAAKLADAEAALAVYNPAVSEEMLAPFVELLKEEHAQLRDLATLWQPYAYLQPLASLCPPEIRITGLDLRMEESGKRTPVLTLRGLVEGPTVQQRSVLAAFVLDLGRMPLVESAVLQPVVVVEEDLRKVLHFTVEMGFQRLRPEVIAVKGLPETGGGQ